MSKLLEKIFQNVFIRSLLPRRWHHRINIKKQKIRKFLANLAITEGLFSFEFNPTSEVKDVNNSW